MKDIKISLEGVQPLLNRLESLRQIKAEGLALQAATQIRERALHNKNTTRGGTPVDTGELRQTAILGKIPHGYYVGYIKEYAPHVEYGHRQNVGQFVPAIGARLVRSWVPGQHFLRDNVRIQEPLLIEATKKAIKKELGKNV